MNIKTRRLTALTLFKSRKADVTKEKDRTMNKRRLH